MRVVLGLEYRGTAYCGWQSQPSGCGVQDHLEAAIASFLVSPARVVCAGRTDTGVHACAQVVHLDTDTDRSDVAWVRGVNASLPRDIRVVWAHRLADLSAEHAQKQFHARFSALSRTYQYLLLNDTVEPALHIGGVGWFHVPLDVGAMQGAADLLLGEQDFSAFRSAECQAKSPVKTMHVAAVSKRDALIVFDFRAGAFLHHMVRNIVGCLVYVGAGRQDLSWFKDVIESRDRAKCAPTFAPDGLHLAGVEYAAAWKLPMFRHRTN